MILVAAVTIEDLGRAINLAVVPDQSAVALSLRVVRLKLGRFIVDILYPRPVFPSQVLGAGDVGVVASTGRVMVN